MSSIILNDTASEIKIKTHMNPRSKKYYESRKAQKGDKKGSSTEAGYNEQNETNSREPKENPAPEKVRISLRKMQWQNRMTPPGQIIREKDRMKTEW